MITTYWVTGDSPLRKQKGVRRIVHQAVLTWDESTTPPTLLQQKKAWAVVNAGAPMHPLFFHRGKLYGVPSTTESCLAQLIFDHQS